MKIDHHMHTSRHSPDSAIDPLQLVERAGEIGLDGVVITEHDYQWEADELAELAAQAAPLRVFSGAEISAREGHFLVTACRRSSWRRRASCLASCSRSSARTRPPSWPRTRFGGTSRSTRSSPSMARFRRPRAGEQQLSTGDPRRRPRHCCANIPWGHRLERRSRDRRRRLLFHRVSCPDRVIVRLRRRLRERRAARDTAMALTLASGPVD